LGRRTGRVEGPRLLFPNLVLGLTHSALAMSARLANDFSGYQGRWGVGVLLDGLKGVVPYDGGSMWQDMQATYSRPEYERQTTTTTEEMMLDAPAVVQRLLGKLIRGLGVEERYLPYSVDRLLKSPD
jgi:hypothetical protein